MDTIDARAISTLTLLDLKVEETAATERTRITGRSSHLLRDITLASPTHPSGLLHPTHRTPHPFVTALTGTHKTPQQSIT